MSPARIGLPLRRNVKIRHWVKLTAVAKAGTTAATLGLATMASVYAGDDLSKTLQIASVGGNQDALPSRLGMPPRPPEAGLDLKVLLVQNRLHTKTDATVGDDVILVALTLSTPKAVDEDIAKQYELELIDRTELPALGLRILQFRTAGNRPTAPIVAQLRNDQRIQRAQHNAEYAAPPQSPPAISRLNGPPEVEVAPEAMRQPDRKPPAVAKTAQKLTAQAPVPEGRAAKLPFKGGNANEEALQPIRIGKVGDVLSGGL